MTKERWFTDADIPAGPFSPQGLHEMSNASPIMPSTQVWREGIADWAPVDEANQRSQPTDPGSPLRAPLLEGPYPETPEQYERPVAITKDRDWSPLPVAPWRRCGARHLDTLFNSLIGVWLLSYVWYSLAPRSADRFFSLFDMPISQPLDRLFSAFFSAFIAAIVGGLVIGATGTSLGKAIFGVKVLDEARQPIGIRRGLEREFLVLWKGLALGIPMLTLFTQRAALFRLERDQTTAWDRGAHLVLHRPNGVLQTALNCVGVVLIVLLFVAIGALGALGELGAL